ncbi:MAG: terpene cyclase/mutase family protein [Phycisphaerales bacterium]|nr:terpene cyclase/mutase family protein [Phycisphaerales bacterium]MCB9858549.1 terpene cyclase/mutase family protein [Phycisphaerales bacterium]
MFPKQSYCGHRRRRLIAVGFLSCLAVLSSSGWTRIALAQLPQKRPAHITEETEKAIKKGLAYLATRQSKDGSFQESGDLGSYPTSMTALAGLALIASGSTPTQGEYAPQLRKSLTYAIESAKRNGLICRDGSESSRSMYGHGFTMLFLAQVMGMEEDPERLARIRSVLRKGVELTERSQSRLGGWLYTPDMDGDEGSVTVTQVQALRAARNAGVAVPKKVIDRAMGYLEKSVQPDGGIAYRVGMSGSRPPITAAAVACWFNAGEYENPLARKALRYCKTNIGVGQNQGGVWGHFFYAHLYLSQVMYLSGEKDWDEYFPKMRDYLLSTQNEDGSWNGDSVGQVYGTSIALLILQLPYNNLPIMQR